MARSGLASANLLFDLGAKVSVTDANDNESTRRNAAQLKSKEIKLELGRHTREFIQGQDLVILSPGVPDTALPVTWADSLKIPVISEIELAWTLCPAEVIAVTGTNGKTTVTTLIGLILAASSAKVFTCGNIGNPFSGEVEKMQAGDYVSLEVSSFQLERVNKFRPKISVILNLSRNHLDRYKGMEDYLAAKKRIFLNQGKDDYLVLNQEDEAIRRLAQETKAQVSYFSKSKDFNPNQAAVLAVGKILDIDEQIILKVLKEFKGVEHRMEQVAEIKGVKFINDSKATTVDATIWALRNLSGPVLLIAGGREKGNDYALIRDLLREKVKEMILIGEAKKKIKDALNGALSLGEAADLPQAVAMAFQKARSGDTVLLSPMCKSFDMFTDYEERGRVFKTAVVGLSGGRG